MTVSPARKRQGDSDIISIKTHVFLMFLTYFEKDNSRWSRYRPAAFGGRREQTSAMCGFIVGDLAIPVRVIHWQL